MLTIQKQLIKYNFSKRNESIKFIVIHDCGSASSAQNNHDYFAGGNRGASADFFVDSNNIIQIIDYIKNYSWAIGDGHGKYGKTNSNTLSIEMCLEKNLQPTSQTVQNTLDLTKFLMKELNIPIDCVTNHHLCSDKICPRSFSANNWAKWNDFKKQLASPTVTNNVIVTSSPSEVKFHKTCVVSADKLNCRKSPINGEVITQFSKGDKLTFVDYNEDKTWGKLITSNWTGWISLNYVDNIEDYIVLSPSQIADAKAGIKFRKSVIVTATVLNCRKTPITGEVIKQFKFNDKLTIIDYDDIKNPKWGKLTFGENDYGWISLDYIK